MIARFLIRTFFSGKLYHSLGTVAVVIGSTSFFAMHSPAIAACEDTAGPGVNWADCRKRNLVMSGSDFSGGNFSGTDLSSSDLRNTNLKKSNFEKANLVRASLAGAVATGAMFEGVVASRTSFKGANLQGASFEKSEIIRADFSEADLTGANLSKGELSRVNFDGTILTNVTFNFANLARSSFKGAKLGDNVSMRGSFLYLTRIEGVDLSKVQNLASWQLEMACGDEKTILPTGLEKPANWPCEDL